MEEIIEIIKGLRPTADIDENTRLLDDHIIDSLTMIQLIGELSDEFDVEIEAQDIVPENFETVAAISKLIERLEDED